MSYSCSKLWLKQHPIMQLYSLHERYHTFLLCRQAARPRLKLCNVTKLRGGESFATLRVFFLHNFTLWLDTNHFSLYT